MRPRSTLDIRPAEERDAAAAAAVFNQGVRERTATFETSEKSPAAFERMIADRYPFVVAERYGEVIGFAKAGPYDPASHYYAGVAEATIFIDREARGMGVGRALLGELIARAAESGRYKLTAKIFTSNEASVALFLACGFRKVGVHRRHGNVEGDWKDVMVVELPLDQPSS